MAGPRLCWLLGLGLLLTGCSDSKSNSPMSSAKNTAKAGNGHEDETADFVAGIQTEPFGTTADGADITQYILTNKNGVKVSLINYGATVTAVEVPDKHGEFANVTLGYPSLDGYLNDNAYFGGIIGRYANRIAKGKFTLGGEEFTLATNNGPNHLHGGPRGFSKVAWVAKPVQSDPAAGPLAVEMTYASKDGEEGYPGNVNVTVVYSLTNDNELKIEYTAVSDKATPLNLTNHAYWNLAGAGSRNVLDHVLQLHCSKYLVADDTLIPTGEIKDVSGTPFDFTNPKRIGEHLADVGGYDLCYVVNDVSGAPAPVATVHDPESGRVLEILSTEPGVQFYTGNFLDGSAGTGGFQKHAGFCLECQHFPDSPNKPDFPKAILEPAQVYKQTTIHKFSVR